MIGWLAKKLDDVIVRIQKEKQAEVAAQRAAHEAERKRVDDLWVEAKRREEADRLKVREIWSNAKLPPDGYTHPTTAAGPYTQPISGIGPYYMPRQGEGIRGIACYASEGLSGHSGIGLYRGDTVLCKVCEKPFGFDQTVEFQMKARKVRICRNCHSLLTELTGEVQGGSTNGTE